jgi:tRNA-specific 2-thiouridylase
VFAAGEGARVAFAEPQYGVAPGQACVFYAGDRVLGGGWIARAEAAAAVA